MKTYRIHVTPDEYRRFRRHPDTRLYNHTWDGVTLAIPSSKPRALARDLEKVINFNEGPLPHLKRTLT